MKRLIILSFLSVIILSSCDHLFGKHIRGNGNIKTETRTAGQFNSIDVSSAIDVYIKQDSAYSVKVEIDENLQQFLLVREENGVLYIKQEDNTNLDPTGKIKVYISAPVFKHFDASGACNLVGENKITATDPVDIRMSGSCDATLDLKTPAIAVDLSGACHLALKGETKDFKVQGSGSTDIRCMELMAENVDIDISGAGDAEVYASVKLNVEVSGSGDVKYKGNATVSQSVSGAGSVKKVE